MSHSNRNWNESLFGCFDNLGICCYGFWCLPCLFGTNAKKVDDRNCCGMCCLYSVLSSCYLCWIPHLLQRQALRKKYHLRSDQMWDDVFATVCCSGCAMCQEAREIQTRRRRMVPYTVNEPAIVTQPKADPTRVYRV